MKYLVTATERELDLPFARALREGGRVPIVTGIGGTNVILALRALPRDADIINVGFCGSSVFDKGSSLWVHDCRLWHPHVDFEERTFKLQESGLVTCLTAGDFVTDAYKLPANAVVDMELAYIAALGFASLQSVKYVSDNLNLKEYNQTANTQTPD